MTNKPSSTDGWFQDEEMRRHSEEIARPVGDEPLISAPSGAVTNASPSLGDDELVALKSRLIETISARSDVLINRDGPEALACIEALQARIEALRPLVEAAGGLSLGHDWNNGAQAKTHGYRRKLRDALPAAIKALSDSTDLLGEK